MSKNMVRHERPTDDERAYWIVPNSVIVRDIIPTWRRLGGGVTESEVQPDLKAAYELAITRTDRRIDEAQSHKRKLQDALAALIDTKGEQ